MPTITKLYTLKEAAEHSSSNDCWVIVDGKEISFDGRKTDNVATDDILDKRGKNHVYVYDVSKYLDEHPGGDDVLLNSAGKDATEEFEDAGHSKTARELMQDFLIGEIDPSPIIDELEIFKKEKRSLLDLKLLDRPVQFWAAPLAIIGVSAVAGLLYLRKK